eukprot:gene33822-39994_t
MWKPGTVTAVTDGRPRVRLNGHHRSFVWEFPKPGRSRDRARGLGCSPSGHPPPPLTAAAALSPPSLPPPPKPRQLKTLQHDADVLAGMLCLRQP